MTDTPKNFYGVAIGRKPGVYTSWALCHEQTDGFSGSCHQGFATLEECLTFLKDKGKFEGDNQITVYQGHTASSVAVFRGDVEHNTDTVHLTLLGLVKRDTLDIPALFCDSLDNFLQYGYTDIYETLNKLEMNTLQSMHKLLVNRVKLTFPAYTEKKSRNRQVKNTVIPDIYNIGYSLIHQQVTKDLEKVFVDAVSDAAQNDTTTDNDATFVANPSELSDLIRTVAGLTRKVAGIESEITSLRQENAQLRSLCVSNKPVVFRHSAHLVASQQQSAPNLAFWREKIWFESF
jgi:hypothetical protein